MAGRATFRGGRSRVEAPENIRVAVEELLARAFVDRIQADERPRGYRRSGSGIVDMLVPGMPEHFIARLRGLWLSYPDGSVVTARAASQRELAADRRRPGRCRRAGDRPARAAHQPWSGQIACSERGRSFVPTRPTTGRARTALAAGPSGRTDCGWLV